MRSAVLVCSSLTFLGLAASPAFAQDSFECPVESYDTEANIQLVLDFTEAVFQNGEIDRVAEFVAEDYIQHNPGIATGRAGLIEAFSGFAPPPGAAPEGAAPPGAVSEPAEIVAQNDLVVLISEMRLPRPDNPDEMYSAFGFDMYRVCDGLLVEHWDGARLGDLGGGAPAGGAPPGGAPPGGAPPGGAPPG